MLAGTRFCDDAPFSHSPGEQGLAEGVVDFVGAGVGQVFTLQVDFCPSAVLGEPGCQGQRCGSADEGLQQVIQFPLKFSFLAHSHIRTFQVLQGWHEGFGDELTTVRPKLWGKTESAILLVHQRLHCSTVDQWGRDRRPHPNRLADFPHHWTCDRARFFCAREHDRFQSVWVS